MVIIFLHISVNNYNRLSQKPSGGVETLTLVLATRPTNLLSLNKDLNNQAHKMKPQIQKPKHIKNQKHRR